eukprot:TRINITY_DN16151_c0_g1_i1.p1 TRINITY_DN16151_c0_g1~~TRINITY_DN16151_c0_g1_i1.p1  ORF type:complete len:421 (-),score=29.44 TRINITY_DN16151_c0_g1_i1:317-1471(-)
MALASACASQQLVVPTTFSAVHEKKRVVSLTTKFFGARQHGILATSKLSAAVSRAVRVTAVLEKAANPTVVSPQDLPQQGWSYAEYGSRDNLKFGDVELPKLAPNQVLIHVAAAALNPLDIQRMHGEFKATDSPLPHVPGYDVAGTVVEVGSAVTKFAVGDRVFGDINEFATVRPKRVGALARFTAAEEMMLAKIPPNLTFAEAAAIPLVALTAMGAFRTANFQPGQSVLILNGAGGVGTMAIQLAKRMFGAGFVATTASLPKVGLLEALGADHVEDYRQLDYTRLPQLYDFVLDCAGEADRAVQVVKPGGVVLCLTGPTPPPAVRFNVIATGAKLEPLLPLLASGAVRAVLDPHGQFHLRDTPSAVEHLESGRATGKVVVSMD